MQGDRLINGGTIEVLDWTAAQPLVQPLRRRVFVIEQGIDAALEHDEHDAASLHALVKDASGRVVGTGRLLPDGHIGRMAVEQDSRNQGVGAWLLNALSERARRVGLHAVVLNAQLSARRFYERHGFVGQGDTFEEAGRLHIFMKKTLDQDENLWLEQVEGVEALDWVKQQNQKSQGSLEAHSGFAELRSRLEAIYQSDQRIPVATVRGEWLYNFWQDRDQVNGVWRRTTLESYQQSEPTWQVLLDLDALSKSEGKNWVWGGAQVLYPNYRHALLKLSVGGSDACVWREFDLELLEFVEDGFVVPEGKAQVAWIDAERIFVCADSGPGSMTASGYPRTVRIWQRGQSLAEAPLEFSVEPSDMMARAWCSRDWFNGVPLERQWLNRQITFQTSQTLVRIGSAWVALDVPPDAEVGTFANQMLVMLKSDWSVASKVWRQGALLGIGMDQFLAGSRDFEVLFAPSERLVLSGWFNTLHHLYLMQMDNLTQKVERLEFDGRLWQRHPVEVNGTVMTELFAFDAEHSDDVWIAQSGPLFPTRLGLVTEQGGTRILKTIPPLFDADGLCVERFDARSSDGTLVPYVVVGKRGAAAGVPTLLSGYGGFEISRLPLPYGAAVGAAWLERGGRYVVAGIRGGGEFGPAWHLAGVREKKQNCFDDFIAVAHDLVARGLAEPSHLGIQGGSNGGLLVGAVMTQAPEAIGAVVCQVPLLDMQRYHKLLAGASWVAEYGDPDLPSDWQFISRYSPYQKLAAGVTYPPTLFATSTRDDRVHPGHARKMAARMLAMAQDVLYYENIEGGHAGAANQRQAAYLAALSFTFLWRALA
jgi:prolyl oligopeptidase